MDFIYYLIGGFILKKKTGNSVSSPRENHQPITNSSICIPPPPPCGGVIRLKDVSDKESLDTFSAQVPGYHYIPICN